jgi:hypothetical protein
MLNLATLEPAMRIASSCSFRIMCGSRLHGMAGNALCRRAKIEWRPLPAGRHDDADELQRFDQYQPNTTYLYRVKALVGSDSSTYSNIDLATTMAFSSIVAGDAVAATHFEELRGAVNAVGAANGSAPLSWAALVPGGQDPAPGAVIYASHIMALRAAMDNARAVLGFSGVVWTDSNLAGQVIRVLHLTDFRGGVE